jgi:hypothetical protein
MNPLEPVINFPPNFKRVSGINCAFEHILKALFQSPRSGRQSKALYDDLDGLG